MMIYPFHSKTLCKGIMLGSVKGAKNKKKEIFKVSKLINIKGIIWVLMHVMMMKGNISPERAPCFTNTM